MFAKPKFAKIGIFGEQKSGKTFTTTELACGLIRKIESDRPLKVFDTDGGYAYRLDRIKTLTGKDPQGTQSVSFLDMLHFTETCEDGDVVIIDSVTNPWVELFRAAKAKYKYFVSAAGAAKDQWAPFSDWVKASNCHVFICGRLAWNYEETIDEDSGKAKSVKSESKMKTEAELGYEPSLLLEISREQRKDGIWNHEVLVKGDRFALIDGKRISFSPMPHSRLKDPADNPTFAALEPWFDMLDLSRDGGTGINTDQRSMEIFSNDSTVEYRKREEERKVLLDEIKDDLVSAFPGQSAEEKKLKVDLIRSAFLAGWSTIEANQDRSFTPEVLRDGRTRLKALIEEKVSQKKGKE